MFALALAVSQILKFQLFDLQKVDQGHMYIFLCYHSLTNIQIYNSRSGHFALPLTISWVSKFKIFDPQKVGQGN